MQLRSRLWILVPFLCCLPLQMGFAQSESVKSARVQPQRLVVKVVDGYTGLPMWFEFPNVWIGSAEDTLPRLNYKGEAQFDVRDAKPRTMRVLPNWYADCRYKSDVTTGSKTKYSIDEILEDGVVTENVCGQIQAKPTPGVIVIYVRHRTLRKVMAL